MYCNKCGKQNDDDAVYCQKCGRLLEAEDETRVVKRNIAAPTKTDDEPAVFKIGPTLKFVKIGYGLAVLGGLFLVILLSVLTPVPIWVSVILALVLLLIPAYFHMRQRLVRYTLTDTRIEIDSGLLSQTTRNIPITRIQDVTVSSGIYQRLLNFGDVVIDNASEDGGKVVIRNIDSPRKYADLLLGQMRRLEK
ncbi:MAG TPA: PH domain-containing protein [Pyrinomonadaceae bacterium]|jgi:membrane protein YdbS with pleckstrin-like domain